MNRIATSRTRLTDAAAAASELVATACARLEATATLAILFATPHYNIPALVAAVQCELGSVPLWGGTSSTGVFTDEGWLAEPGGSAALMLVAQRPAGVSVCHVRGEPLAAGRTAAATAVQRASDQGGALLAIAYPGPEEDVLAGITEAAPRIPLVGGSASDHAPAPRFQQFGDGDSHTGAVSIAALGGAVHCAFAHGYESARKRATITRASGRRLLALDHRPALDIYADWTGRSAGELRDSAILTYSVLHPLLLHTPDGTLAVHPVSANPDGSIDTGVALFVGMTAELGDGTPDSLIAGVGDTVRRAARKVNSPEAVILAHCGGRALALGSRLNEVGNQVRAVVGGVPWIGWLAFGEQGNGKSGRHAHANLSLSAMVLGKE